MHAKRASLIGLLLTLLVGESTVMAGTLTHVIHISVDGLHYQAVPRLLAAEMAPGDLVPNFRRLRNEGAATDNARCDPVLANTLPNHACMITGRHVLGPRGHGLRINRDPAVGQPFTLHKTFRGYIPSVFDVVHDNGLSTALYAGKSKFDVFDRSYDAANGAQDVTGADNGDDKIDDYLVEEDQDALVAAFTTAMPTQLYHYVLLHLRGPDSAGHGNRWDLSTNPLSPYMAAVVEVDDKLGEIFDMIENTPALSSSTAIILTADHGGEADTFVHFILRLLGWIDSAFIPFYVWGPDVGVGTGDLYAMNTGRRDPGMEVPTRFRPRAPIRNGDAANLALDLLGLPPIPGSRINASQDLSVGP